MPLINVRKSKHRDKDKDKPDAKSERSSERVCLFKILFYYYFLNAFLGITVIYLFNYVLTFDYENKRNLVDQS